GDEVDQRLRVLDVLHEVGPARVGLELRVADGRVEFATRLVQRRNAGVAAARDVEHREAEQVAAQRLGDELVDLVADRAGDAAHDRARRLFGGRTARRIGQGVEEGRD